LLNPQQADGASWLSVVDKPSKAMVKAYQHLAQIYGIDAKKPLPNCAVM
jgi:hypothetical protein